MTAQWQRSTATLRDRSAMQTVECVGTCGAEVKTRCSWGLCPGCLALADSYIRAQTRGLTGPEYRTATNAFWSSESTVKAAIGAGNENRS